ncbi:MAG: YqgE/AlgH family protein [Legionella sp.]|jgi:putative transcriptional regulator|nr:YqgE/AlgH family protein [Legionella sp.]
MGTPLALRNHLLAAMPVLHGTIFERSVVYVCEHQPEGAVGLMINRPLEYSLSFMFDQLHIKSDRSEQRHKPLLLGGPMQPERGFVIHRPCGNWRSSLVLDDDVTITTSNDIIRAIAQNHGPKDSLVALGFVAWGEKALDKEIEEQWLVCPYEPELLYEVPFDERWEKTAETIGVNVGHIMPGAGHA